MTKKPTFLISFFRSQIAAIIATGVDFCIMVLLTEWVGLWYVLSNVLSATTGAIVNFLLGRYWSFVSTENKVSVQAILYVLVAVGSLILNTLGVYIFTEYFEANYVLSKAITAVLIGVFYNFTMQRKVVFK